LVTDPSLHLQAFAFGCLDIPALLRGGRELAACCPLHEQLGVITGRGVAAADHAASLELGQDCPRQLDQLGDRQRPERLLVEPVARVSGRHRLGLIIDIDRTS
jgi:hypothetical protein